RLSGPLAGRAVLRLRPWRLRASLSLWLRLPLRLLRRLLRAVLVVASPVSAAPARQTAGGRRSAAGDRRPLAAQPRDGQPRSEESGLPGPAQRPAPGAAAEHPGDRGARRRRS